MAFENIIAKQKYKYKHTQSWKQHENINWTNLNLPWSFGLHQFVMQYLDT